VQLSFKWQKILLLHFFDFASKIEIELLAHRFSLGNIDEMLYEIELDIKNNGDCIYIVELVPVCHQYKLPNYMIRTVGDLSGVVKFVRNNQKRGFEEIWYYRKQEVQACGRILFSNIPLSNQTLEVIDGNTVRNLESKKCNFFFRADRIDWGWSYSIKESYFSVENEVLAINTLTKVFVEFEKQKTQVYHLGNFFRELGLHDFTLDFLLIKGILYIIDWDTGNDTKVFNYLNTNDFESWNDYYVGE